MIPLHWTVYGAIKWGLTSQTVQTTGSTPVAVCGTGSWVWAAKVRILVIVLLPKLASPVPHPAWLVAVWHRIQERGYLTISSSMYTLLIIHPNNNFDYSMQKGVEQILTGVSLGPTLTWSAWTFSVFSTYTLVCTCCSPIPFRAEILFDKTTLPNYPKYGLMLTHITWLNQWDASFEKLVQYVGSISNPCPDCKQFNQIINRSARFEMGKGYAKSESWYAQSEIRPMRALDGLVTRRSMVNRLHM